MNKETKTMDADSSSRSLVPGDAELDANIVKHLLEICFNDAYLLPLLFNFHLSMNDCY